MLEREMSSNYEKYTNTNPIAGYLNRSFLDALCDLTRKTGAKKILDAGCGEGFVLERLTKDHKAEFIGVDIEPAALQVAIKKNPAIEFEHASVYELPFEDKSFDLVILSEVLEHLDDPIKALNEIRRVSSNNVIISVPHEPIWRVGNMARFKYLRAFGNTPGHINHWTRRAFVGLISGHFEINQLRSPFPWTIALCNLRDAN